MLSEKLLEAINQQIQKELYSAYLYLSMSAYFEAHSLPGFAKWTRMQAQEEVEHAMKFYDYVNDRGGRVVLLAIQQPQVEFNSPLEVFEAILEHEQLVTASINNLYTLALKENDYAAQVMLHWFIDEQVEEEKNAGQIVDHLRMVEDHKVSLINLDHQVGKREAEED
ncbi:MAG: ferritin [Anaerolineales bacterium]|nr:ferritin [Anaerolineales bacterium]